MPSAPPTAPFCLLVDDADSMPPATVAALAGHLPRTGAPLRVLLALHRDARGSRLLAALHTLAPQEVVFRERMNVAETRHYLRQRMRRAGFAAVDVERVDDEVARLHQSLSGGVPRAIHRQAWAGLRRVASWHRRGLVRRMDGPADRRRARALSRARRRRVVVPTPSTPRNPWAKPTRSSGRGRSLVARLTGGQEVAGSSPAGPTSVAADEFSAKAAVKVAARVAASLVAKTLRPAKRARVAPATLALHAATSPVSPRSVADRVVLITGAASGMGRATAHLFADEGARVAVTDLERARVDAVVQEIDAAGGTAAGFVLDVADLDQIHAVVDAVRDRLGPIDILVNNAGVSLGASLEQPDADYEPTWQRALDVMLSAHQRMVRACLPQLVRNGDGRIVNVASTEGLGATAGTGPYTAAKHGVIGLTRSMAVELARTGVTVNCICPGPILTGMTEAIPEAAREKFARRRVPARRYGSPEEVAHMTLSLALPAASFLNGVALPVDGGLTIQNT